MLNRILTFILAAACIVLTFALTRAGGTPEATSSPATAPAAEATAATQPSNDDDAVLNQRIKELKFDNVRLQDAIGSIAELTMANIYVNWPSLEGAGIDRGAPIKLHLWNVTLRGALNILVDDAGSGNARLAYTMSENIITITTAEDAARNTVTEFYNIRELADEIVEVYADHAKKTPPDRKVTYQEAVDELVKLITDTVAPESWRDAGGTVGSIREIGALLVITMPPENQKEIANLLLNVRDAMHRHELLPATRPAVKSH